MTKLLVNVFHIKWMPLLVMQRQTIYSHTVIPRADHHRFQWVQRSTSKLIKSLQKWWDWSLKCLSFVFVFSHSAEFLLFIHCFLNDFVFFFSGKTPRKAQHLHVGMIWISPTMMNCPIYHGEQFRMAAYHGITLKRLWLVKGKTIVIILEFK